jgi:hypothetical protein
MNSYSFVRANPISYFDPDGQFPVTITIIRNGYNSQFGIIGTFSMVTPGGVLSGSTLERPFLGEKLAQTSGSLSAIMPGRYSGYLAHNYPLKGGQMVDTIILEGTLLGKGKTKRIGICIHNGSNIDDSEGCILLLNSIRQRMYDIVFNQMIMRMCAEVGLDSGAMLVLEAFMSLPSDSWFPEITLDILNGLGMFITTPLPNDPFYV